MIHSRNVDVIGTGAQVSLFTGTLSFWTFGLEVLFAYNHGARSVPLSYLWTGIPLMLVAAVASAWLEKTRGIEMAAVTLMVFVALLHRRDEAWHTLKSGTEDRNTYFMGYSVLLFLEPVLPRALHWLFDEWTAYRFIHPLIAIVLGLIVLLTGASVIVSIWAIGGGICLGLKASILYGKLVNILLDQYDSTLTRLHVPRILRERGAGSNTHDHAGIPITSTLIDILRNMPAPPMEEIVENAMSNGATPPPVQRELFYDEPKA